MLFSLCKLELCSELQGEKTPLFHCHQHTDADMQTSCVSRQIVANCTAVCFCFFCFFYKVFKEKLRTIPRIEPHSVSNFFVHKISKLILLNVRLKRSLASPWKWKRKSPTFFCLITKCKLNHPLLEFSLLWSHKGHCCLSYIHQSGMSSNLSDHLVILPHKHVEHPTKCQCWQ